MEAPAGRLVWIGTGAGLLAGLVLGGLVTLGLLTLGGGEDPGGPPGGGKGGPPPASVRVGLVEFQRLQQRVPIVGRLQEVRRVELTSEVEGKIVEVAVDAGTPVKGGETIIARIDDVWAKLRLRTTEADVAEARAQLDQSRSDLNQLEQLLTAGSAKQKEVEDQRTTVAGDEARLAAVEAAEEQAQTQLERSVIVAPFDGAVSAKLAEVGQWVDPGDGIVQIVSTGEIDAIIDLPEMYVSALSLGDEVEIVIDPVGLRMTGKVESIRPDAMNASRTFPVKVRLHDAESQLRPGMSVVAHVPIAAEAELVTVPRDAVLFGASGATVWFALETPKAQSDPAAAGDGDAPPATPTNDAAASGTMAMSEPVRLLFGVGDRYAVESLPGARFPALREGTRVVIEGAERLFPTQPLNIVNNPEQAAAAVR